MTKNASDVAFTPTVKAIQEKKGSRRDYAYMDRQGGWETEVTQVLEVFIAERDTLFLGTANADGQPYIQHRGGPKGFLKVIDKKTLGFADYSGNRQYITLGNLQDNSRAFIFLLDFANKQRIKIWGTAKVVEGDPDLINRLRDADYHPAPERVILFHVEAWDINCPQHITPRFTAEEVQTMLQPLHARIAELEQELVQYKGERRQLT